MVWGLGVCVGVEALIVGSSGHRKFLVNDLGNWGLRKWPEVRASARRLDSTKSSKNFFFHYRVFAKAVLFFLLGFWYWFWSLGAEWTSFLSDCDGSCTAKGGLLLVSRFVHQLFLQSRCQKPVYECQKPVYEWRNRLRVKKPSKRDGFFTRRPVSSLVDWYFGGFLHS